MRYHKGHATVVTALASCESVWEPSGIGFIIHRGNFWCLLIEDTPEATSPSPTSATKTLSATSKPSTATQEDPGINLHSEQT